MFTTTAVIAGQLLGAAFAAGLNLYATVALIALAARANLIAPLPPDLRGLSHPLVIILAALLFFLELVIEKLPFVGAIWAGAHTMIRPVAAGLLTFLAFAHVALDTRIAIAVAAGIVAFAAHGAKTGLRVMLAAAQHQRSALYNAAAALVLDLLAIAVAIATLLYPEAALATGVAAIVLLALVGPRLWRAATFGARALLARLVGFFGHRGWKSRPELPRRIRAAVPPPQLGHGEPRGTRVAAVGIRGAGAYRNGWLVLEEQGPCFVFRTFFGARRVPLPQTCNIELRAGPVIDLLRAHCGSERFTLFLLKDGPSTDNMVAALTHHE